MYGQESIRCVGPETWCGYIRQELLDLLGNEARHQKASISPIIQASVPPDIATSSKAVLTTASGLSW